MGAIASVLQWHCVQCSLINPTEQATCVRCNCVRRTGTGDDSLCPPEDSRWDHYDGGHEAEAATVPSMAVPRHLFGGTVIRRVRSNDNPQSTTYKFERGFSTATLVRSTALLTASTLLLIAQRRASPRHSICRQWASVPCLRRLYRCEACLVLFTSAGNPPCVLCSGQTAVDEDTATMMMVNVCKNCQSGGCNGSGGAVGGGASMVPVEQLM